MLFAGLRGGQRHPAPSTLWICDQRMPLCCPGLAGPLTVSVEFFWVSPSPQWLFLESDGLPPHLSGLALFK